MALPPSFLNDLRDRVTLSELAKGRVGAYDRKKSNPGRRDYWYPCPFHEEKTASFHIDDNKGRYHCFGCEASGNIFDWVMETERLSFPEAVRKLAGVAGVPMPETSFDKQKHDKKRDILDVLKIARDYFQDMLFSAAGAEGLSYLREKRGLSDETIKNFALGYAPDRRGALTDYLRARNVSEELAVAAGVTIKPDKGGAAYDRFRHRVIFPVCGTTGDVLTFGGRALSAEVAAKYLNGPETEAFYKSRTLYNIDKAGPASHKAKRLIVCEGYTDVIALAQAGIGECVAPMGTALTEEQMKLLWRYHAEPILCFDGDQAGLHAAFRAAERALPLLSPGRSLHFMLMTDGKDPDELVKEQGAGAFIALTQKTVTLSHLLFVKELQVVTPDTPERAAGFEMRLDELVERIKDDRLRRLYRQEMTKRLQKYFGEAAPVRPEAPKPRFPAPGNRAYGRRENRDFRGDRGTNFAPSQALDIVRDRKSNFERANEREEREIIGLALKYPELPNAEFDSFCAFTPENPAGKKLCAEIIEKILLNDDSHLDESETNHYLSMTSENERFYLASHSFETTPGPDKTISYRDICLQVAEKSLGDGSRLSFINPSERISYIKSYWSALLERRQKTMVLMRDIREAKNELEQNMTEECNARYKTLLEELREIYPHETVRDF